MSEFERGYLQQWEDGRDDAFEVFMVRTHEMDVYGVEASGVIYYVVPSVDGDEVIVFITLGRVWEELIAILLDYSQPRFEVLAEHCPKFCRAVLDGFTEDSRFDRGAFARIDNVYVLARQTAYDFKDLLESDSPTDAVVSRNLVNVVTKLIELQNSIVGELSAFDGFSTLEEVKISAQEIWNGAKIGWQYGRILSFLGL